ncbi:hypothetical protein Ahy_B06g082953 [Arachis hypogaea]|uniref:Uncharacterized protein n=1 Tax=Arachis hypogaea TaxID=3818 RepID=A0A444YP36_ARAHY|nr:hypothetical protein Ahy_B06g082953 [Arachis hypogaea]
MMVDVCSCCLLEFVLDNDVRDNWMTYIGLIASDLLHFTCKEKLPEEDPVEEVNPKELNPYLKDNGSGYPEESDRTKVVAERWGSLGDLTASNAVAPARAHVRAIRSRQRGETEEKSADTDKQSRRDYKRDYSKDVSVRHSEMKAPKVRDSLSWGKQKSQHSAKFVSNKSSNYDSSSIEGIEPVNDSSEANAPDNSTEVMKTRMTTNQLAARAIQLRLKGKREEAEKLMSIQKRWNEAYVSYYKKVRASNSSTAVPLPPPPSISSDEDYNDDGDEDDTDDYS